MLFVHVFNKLSGDSNLLNCNVLIRVISTTKIFFTQKAKRLDSISLGLSLDLKSAGMHQADKRVPDEDHLSTGSETSKYLKHTIFA
jgi:hypothetical protein